jgi:GNAT superfamily N-acetyltransferase
MHLHDPWNPERGPEDSEVLSEQHLAVTAQPSNPDVNGRAGPGLVRLLGELKRGARPGDLTIERSIAAGRRSTEKRDRLANADDVIAEIESCWASLADFRRSGFGLIAHDARAIVCWCTAEFVSDGKCGIGIETIPAYRGRGFATLTASAFLEHCAERAMTPHWDAWMHNVPSVAVAEMIGLDKVETYAIYVCEFGDIATAGMPYAGEDPG